MDESLEEACIREVKEETGFDVLHLQLVQVYHTRDGQEYYFMVKVPPGEAVLGGSEAEEQSPDNTYVFEWVEAENLPRTNIKPIFARQMCIDLIG